MTDNRIQKIYTRALYSNGQLRLLLDHNAAKQWTETTFLTLERRIFLTTKICISYAIEKGDDSLANFINNSEELDQVVDRLIAKGILLEQERKVFMQTLAIAITGNNYDPNMAINYEILKEMAISSCQFIKELLARHTPLTTDSFLKVDFLESR